MIAPDYAGLGTAGIQGYLVSRDTAYSVLDSSQALWNLREHVTELEPRYAVVGHSQGGSAALSTQALAQAEGGEPELDAVVAIAPGLWAYTDSPSPIPWQAAPLTSTSVGSGILAAASVLYLYADASNALGADQAGAYFHPALRLTLEQLVEEECVFEIAAALPWLTPTFDGLYAPGFSAGVASCLDGGACAPPHADFADRLRDNFIPIDPNGAEILVVQGLLDTLATPDLAQCYVTALEQMSAPLKVCVDGTEHFGVALANVGLIHDWLDATFSGQPPPACSELPLPPCSL